MKFLNLLKKLPIDLGQGEYRDRTKGKKIAMRLIGDIGGTALDVGCREGHQTLKLESMGFEVTSIDIEKSFHRCIIMDAEKELPLPDESFDLVWCSEVIEHLEDPAASIEELRRILKPGGRLIITTPNSYFWLFRILGLMGIPPAKVQHPGHKHFFHYRSIRELFPYSVVYGYFPYVILKFRIRHLVGLLSPTFVVMESKS